MSVDQVCLCLGVGAIGNDDGNNDGTPEQQQSNISRRTEVPSFITDWAEQGLLTSVFSDVDLAPVDKLLRALIQEDYIQTESSRKASIHEY
jgi:hypothetical protein